MLKRSFNSELIDTETAHARIDTMAKIKNIQITQINGQRISTFMSYKQLPQPKKSEVFIGKLPKNIYEDELIPLFERAGRLYNFRLMLDFNYKNRGFAFACYLTNEEAQIAVNMLNEYEIRKRCKIGVYISMDNCRLFFGNLNPRWTKNDLRQILEHYRLDGIKDIILYQDLSSPELNRGYAFVEFENHQAASMVRKQLYPCSLMIDNFIIHCDWADPIPIVDEEVMSKVTIIFISNLPLNISTTALKIIITEIVAPIQMTKLHKQKNFAFVHFVNRKSAESALKLLNQKFPLDGVTIEWARPREYSKELRLQVPPTNFCLSLPPKLRKHHLKYIGKMTHDNDGSKEFSMDLSDDSTDSGQASMGSQSPPNIRNESMYSFTDNNKTFVNMSPNDLSSTFSSINLYDPPLQNNFKTPYNNLNDDRSNEFNRTKLMSSESSLFNQPIRHDFQISNNSFGMDTNNNSIFNNSQSLLSQSFFSQPDFQLSNNNYSFDGFNRSLFKNYELFYNPLDTYNYPNLF